MKVSFDMVTKAYNAVSNSDNLDEALDTNEYKKLGMLEEYDRLVLHFWRQYADPCSGTST